MNAELETVNDFLASLSMKISRYLSPQIYKSIFSGQRRHHPHRAQEIHDLFLRHPEFHGDDGAAATRSDHATAQRRFHRDVEDRAGLRRHDRQIRRLRHADFLRRPGNQRRRQDAKACLRMAIEMQDRIAGLNAKWRNAGIEFPFRVRMGINTGFCNVGNFGSADRMDYTIIGAEANLAARLQSVAEPGHIVVSYETYALVRDVIVAHELLPITMKGISREVIPYAVDGIVGAEGETIAVFSEHLTGLDFYLNANMVDADSAGRIRKVLRDALDALDKGAPAQAAGKSSAAATADG
jgi:adenylate cyclase